jgi:hypothetical protein
MRTDALYPLRLVVTVKELPENLDATTGYAI